MTAADLVVTKPGGLSVSECLAKRKPMLLVSPIPGQEERNADYLLEAGAAIKAVDAATLEFKLGAPARDRARLRAMSAAAHSIARPRCGARRACANIRASHETTLAILACSPHSRRRSPRRTPRQPDAAAPPRPRAPAHWAEPIALEGVPNLHRISPTLYRSEQPTRARHEEPREARHPHGHQPALFQRRPRRSRREPRCAPSARRSSPGASTTNTSSTSCAC